MDNIYSRYKSQINKILFLAGFAMFIYVFIIYVFEYIAPFFLAFVLSLMMEPLVRLLHKKLRLGRGMSALFCIVITTFAICLLGTFIVGKIIEEARSFIGAMPYYINEASNAIEGLKIKHADFIEMIPLEIRNYLDSLFPSIANFLSSVIKNEVRSGSLSFFSGISKIFTGLILFLMSTFFFIKDKYLIREVVVKNTPYIILRYYNILKNGLFYALGGYVRAQATIMAVIAIIDISGLLLIGYPYALLVGLSIALTDALPLFGSGIILVPWSLLSILTGNYDRAIALLVIYGMNFVTRQLMEPKVLSTQMGLYPIASLMSIYVGLKLFGLVGFIIGPIIVITLKIVNNSNATTQ